jgi:hypothetical protein
VTILSSLRPPGHLCDSFFGVGKSKSFFRVRRAGQNKKMAEEEAEHAEVGSGKNMMGFGGPGNVGKAGRYFLCTLTLELLAIFTSACSATSAVKFFIQ